jgi:hypothetical protein
MQTPSVQGDENLLGRELSVIVSDPWDFSSAWGSWRRATIERLGYAFSTPTTSAILIRLAMPIDYHSTHCEYFVAAPRYEGQTLDLLNRTGLLEAVLTCLPRVAGAKQRPF